MQYFNHSNFLGLTDFFDIVESWPLSIHPITKGLWWQMFINLICFWMIIQWNTTCAWGCPPVTNLSSYLPSGGKVSVWSSNDKYPWHGSLWLGKEHLSYHDAIMMAPPDLKGAVIMMTPGELFCLFDFVCANNVLLIRTNIIWLKCTCDEGKS